MGHIVMVHTQVLADGCNPVNLFMVQRFPRVPCKGEMVVVYGPFGELARWRVDVRGVWFDTCDAGEAGVPGHIQLAPFTAASESQRDEWVKELVAANWSKG